MRNFMLAAALTLAPAAASAQISQAPPSQGQYAAVISAIAAQRDEALDDAMRLRQQRTEALNASVRLTTQLLAAQNEIEQLRKQLPDAMKDGGRAAPRFIQPSDPKPAPSEPEPPPAAPAEPAK